MRFSRSSRFSRPDVFLAVAVTIHQATGLERHGLDILVFLLARRDPLGPHRSAVGEGIRLADGLPRLAHRVFVGGRLEKPRQRGSLEIVGRLPLGLLGIVWVEHAGFVVRQVFHWGQVSPEDVDDRFEIVISQFSVMDILKNATREHLGRSGVLSFDQVFGLVPVEQEANGHQQEDSQAEDEAAFPLQAGFTKQVLETAIRHGSKPSAWSRDPREPRSRSRTLLRQPVSSSIGAVRPAPSS